MSPPVDALDPGEDGSYPHLRRNADGTLDTDYMPVEPYVDKGRLIDPTPSVRLPDGRVVPITDVVPPPGTGGGG